MTDRPTPPAPATVAYNLQPNEAEADAFDFLRFARSNIDRHVHRTQFANNALLIDAVGWIDSADRILRVAAATQAAPATVAQEPIDKREIFPNGWLSAAVKPPAPDWYERRYSDGVYAHYWNGEIWSATKNGKAHWRQLADAPYPLWHPMPLATPSPAAPGQGAQAITQAAEQALIVLETTALDLVHAELDRAKQIYGPNFRQHHLTTAEAEVAEVKNTLGMLRAALLPAAEGQGASQPTLTDDQIEVMAREEVGGELDWNDPATHGATAVKRAFFRFGAKAAIAALRAPDLSHLSKVPISLAAACAAWEQAHQAAPEGGQNNE